MTQIQKKQNNSNKPITAKIFEEAFTVSRMNKIMRRNAINTAKKAFEAQGLTIARAKKQLKETGLNEIDAEDLIIDYIKTWIIELNKAFYASPEKFMSEFQVDELALAITQTYYYFSFVEIALCFRFIISGRYEKMYVLHIQYVLQNFEHYRKERMQALRKIESENYNKELLKLHASIKNSPTAKMLAEKFKID